MNAFNRSTIWFRFVALAALVVSLSATQAQAGSHTAVGLSPTTYIAPAGAQQELDAFQILQRQRDNGQLTPDQYQQQVMALAGGNKEGLGGSGSSPDVILEPILPPVNPAPEPGPASAPAPPTDFVSNGHSPRHHSLMDGIQRPSDGAPSLAGLKDVASN